MNVNTRDGSWVQTQMGASERCTLYLNPPNTNADISWIVSVVGFSCHGDNHTIKGIGAGFPVLELGAVLPMQQECLCPVTWATGHWPSSHYYISYCKIRATHHPTHLCFLSSNFTHYLSHSCPDCITQLTYYYWKFKQKKFFLLWWNKIFQIEHGLQ